MICSSGHVRRRELLKGSLAAGAVLLARPSILRAQSADVVKIGLDNPLTGTYAAVGKNELIGCQLATDQINAKGGILGRKLELVVEDSTSGDAGTAVQKARKLIDGDKVSFLLGQHQFGPGARHGPGRQRKEGDPHRAGRSH